MLVNILIALALLYCLPKLIKLGKGTEDDKPEDFDKILDKKISELGGQRKQKNSRLDPVSPSSEVEKLLKDLSWGSGSSLNDLVAKAASMDLNLALKDLCLAAQNTPLTSDYSLFQEKIIYTALIKNINQESCYKKLSSRLLSDGTTTKWSLCQSFIDWPLHDEFLISKSLSLRVLKELQNFSLKKESGFELYNSAKRHAPVFEALKELKEPMNLKEAKTLLKITSATKGDKSVLKSRHPDRFSSLNLSKGAMERLHQNFTKVNKAYEIVKKAGL